MESTLSDTRHSILNCYILKRSTVIKYVIFDTLYIPRNYNFSKTFTFIKHCLSKLCYLSRN